MTREAFLARIAEVEGERRTHARQARALRKERDSLIHQALLPRDDPKLAGDIAEIIHTSQSWPYRLRDEFLGKLESGWYDKSPTADR